MRDSQVSAKVLRELGRRVRSARIALDLTQEQAAAAADIDYKHWQAIEAGRANATMRTLVHVARALRMTVWELLGPEAPVEEPKRARVRRRRS